MAQPVTCDICGQENSAQMLTNLETGETIAMGPACLPVFYGQSLLVTLGAGDHRGLPQKCQACRRVHEHMTLAARAGQPTDDVAPGNVRDQAGPATSPHGDNDQSEMDAMAAEPDHRAAGGES